MKLIDKQPKQDSIPIHLCSESAFYGYDVNGCRGFLSQYEGLWGHTPAICHDLKFHANKGISLHDIIKGSEGTFYQFDTARELFAWLAKE